jgi:hypothetical protein
MWIGLFFSLATFEQGAGENVVNDLLLSYARRQANPKVALHNHIT